MYKCMRWLDLLCGYNLVHALHSHLYVWILGTSSVYPVNFNSIRELVDSLCREVILKQTPYNLTTNRLISAQTSSLSAFMISNSHITGQKPHGRQLNAKGCSSESAIVSLFLSCWDHYVQQQCLANGLCTHRHFSMKLMLITAGSSRSLSVFVASNLLWSTKVIHNTLRLLFVTCT